MPTYKIKGTDLISREDAKEELRKLKIILEHYKGQVLTIALPYVKNISSYYIDELFGKLIEGKDYDWFTKHFRIDCPNNSIAQSIDDTVRELTSERERQRILDAIAADN